MTSTYERYDYEKENNKPCPICDKIIDYHVDGFFHDTVLNVWICREHTLEEISQVITLKDVKLIEFIKQGEAQVMCPRCAGKDSLEPEAGDLIELFPCIVCGKLTAPEMGGVLLDKIYHPGIL